MEKEERKNSEKIGEEPGNRVYKKVGEEEFLQTQLVVRAELKSPMHHGKREISFLDVSIYDADSITICNNVLRIVTIQDGVSEHFPMDNVVKWRIDVHFIPLLPGHELESYEYSPYAYPERVGGYLGSYSNDKGCLGFLDTDMQITMMEDLEA